MRLSVNETNDAYLRLRLAGAHHGRGGRHGLLEVVVAVVHHHRRLQFGNILYSVLQNFVELELILLCKSHNTLT